MTTFGMNVVLMCMPACDRNGLGADPSPPACSGEALFQGKATHVAAQASRNFAEKALDYARVQRRKSGLDDSTDFRVRSQYSDESGVTHVRLFQTYKGLSVLHAEFIVNFLPGGSLGAPDGAIVTGISLDTKPRLPASKFALEGARVELAIRVERAPVSTVDERRNGDDSPPPFVLERAVLVYRIVSATDGSERIVDAATGALLAEYPGQDASAPNGHSQYNGDVQVVSWKNLLKGSLKFEMGDSARRINVYDAMGSVNLDGKQLFADDNDIWGYDAANQGNVFDIPAMIIAKNQTAAVDIQYGLRTAWDMYSNVLKRNGCDGKGRRIRAYAHYGSKLKNAYWDNSSFSLLFGDGDPLPFTTLDIVGHELFHCVTKSDDMPSFVKEGIGFGLDEAFSDIFGQFSESYAYGGGSGNFIPPGGTDWFHGNELNIPQSNITSGRNLKKPSAVVGTDAWFPEMPKWGTKHELAGPMNRAAYFLSQGASDDPHAPSFSPYVPRGMTGMGNDRAARVLYRALQKLSPMSNYQDVSAKVKLAGEELYGPEGAKVAALAFVAVGISSGWLGKKEHEPNSNWETANNLYSTLLQHGKISAEGTLESSKPQATDVDTYRLRIPPYATVAVVAIFTDGNGGMRVKIRSESGAILSDSADFSGFPNFAVFKNVNSRPMDIGFEPSSYGSFSSPRPYRLQVIW